MLADTAGLFELDKEGGKFPLIFGLSSIQYSIVLTQMDGLAIAQRILLESRNGDRRNLGEFG